MRSFLLSLALLLAFSASVPLVSYALTTEADLGDQVVDVSKEKDSVRENLKAMDLFIGGNFVIEKLLDAFEYLSNACYYGLIYVYRLIGTILIPIPDLTNPESYFGDAASVVRDVYSIMKYLGFFFAIVCFVAYIGPMASGLTGGEAKVTAFMRLAIALALIFAWPHIYSLCSNMATELGYLIYGQNRISSVGVLEGIKSLDASDWTGTVASSSGSNAPHGSNVRIYTRSIWSVVYTLCLFLSLIGIFIGGRKFSQGDQNGLKIVFSALIGLALILAAGHFARYLIPSLSAIEGSNPITSSNVITANGTTNLPGTHITPSSPSDFTSVENYSSFVGSLIRVIISLWGLVICVGVLLAKFAQVASLLVLFMLGPVLAGMVAHPRTEQIARNGLSLMLNLMLNSIIWAITLLGLYLITHIDFGVEKVGVGNLLTSFAILAGLQLIQNSDKFASLFAHSAGLGGPGNISGLWAGAIGATAAASRTVSDTKRLIADKGQMSPVKGAGAAAGAALGAFFPVVGPVIGAKAGSAVAHLGSAALKFAGASITGPSNQISGQQNRPINAAGAAASKYAQGRSPASKPPTPRST